MDGIVDVRVSCVETDDLDFKNQASPPEVHHPDKNERRHANDDILRDWMRTIHPFHRISRRDEGPSLSGV
jgi:hypothetical protein